MHQTAVCVGAIVVAAASFWLGGAATAEPDEEVVAESGRDEASEPGGSVEDRIRELQETVARLEAERAADAAEMHRLRAALSDLAVRVANHPGAGGSAHGGIVRIAGSADDEPVAVTPEAAGTPPVVAAEDATPSESDSRVGLEKEGERYTQGERDVLERQGGVLLPPGQLVIEPGFEYTTLDRDKLQVSGFSLIPALIIGRFELNQISRDIYTPYLSVRYGAASWLEAAVDVPYFIRKDRYTFTEGTDPNTNSAVDRQQSIDGNGIGDIQFGLNGHVIREGGWIPDTLLRVIATAPTGNDPFEVDAAEEVAVGSGTWSVAPGFTVVKTVDPAVVFASGSYTFNFARNVDGLGRYDPGDGWEYNLGLALALNERMALSFSLQDRIFEKSSIDDVDILRTDANAGTFYLGLSYALSQTLSTNFSLGIGITEDAPDFSVEIRLPYRVPYRFPNLDDLWRRERRMSLAH